MGIFSSLKTRIFEYLYGPVDDTGPGVLEERIRKRLKEGEFTVMTIDGKEVEQGSEDSDAKIVIVD